MRRTTAAAALVGVIFNSAPLGAQTEECATPLAPEDAAHAADLARAGAYDIPLGLERGAQPYIVGLTFHVVRRTDGSEGIDPAQLDQALIDANEAYAPLGIQFCLPGPTRFINSDAFYFNIDSTSEINALRNTGPVPGTINCYFTPNLKVNASTSICGISSFTFSSVQGIVMNNACTGLASNPSTFPHEIGHYFDLFHTHETGLGAECVSGSNCATAGDQVCDTPADPTLGTSVVNSACLYTGATQDPCTGLQYAPDPRNFMSYSRKECRDRFSDGQAGRALGALLNLRPELMASTNCPQPCPGDSSRNALVDFDDITTTLALWGQGGPIGDANGDGAVDFDDLTATLAHWGDDCP